MADRIFSTAVVNGATGVVGSALVRRLLDKRVKVFAVVRPDCVRKENIPKEAEIINCGLNEILSLPEKIPDGADMYFHLAWASTIGPGRNDMIAQTENIRAAVEAVQSCRRMHVKVFVGAGSQAEYGRINGKVTPEMPCFPNSGYGMAKLCAGQMTRSECGKYGIRHVWARLLSVYGPHDGPLSVMPMIIRSLKNREIPPLTESEQMWDFIYADDAADALIAMAENGRDGAVYPVGSGKARMLKSYFEILRDTIDPEAPLGFGKITADPGKPVNLCADIRTLKTDTGFEPKISFEEGIRRTVESFDKKEDRTAT